MQLKNDDRIKICPYLSSKPESIEKAGIQLLKYRLVCPSYEDLTHRAIDSSQVLDFLGEKG